MSGLGWANVGVLKYVYGDLSGRAATPQVLVVARSLQSEQGDYRFRDERVLSRAVGAEEIRKWVEAGAPFSTRPGPALEW